MASACTRDLLEIVLQIWNVFGTPFAPWRLENLRRCDFFNFGVAFLVVDYALVAIISQLDVVFLSISSCLSVFFVGMSRDGGRSDFALFSASRAQQVARTEEAHLQHVFLSRRNQICPPWLCQFRIWL